MKKATLYQKNYLPHSYLGKKKILRFIEKTTPNTLFFSFFQIQSLKMVQVSDNFTFKNSSKKC